MRAVPLRISPLSVFAVAALASASPALAQEQPPEGGPTGPVLQFQIVGTVTAACTAETTFASVDVGDMRNTAGGLNAAVINGRTSTNVGQIFCNGANSELTVEAAPIVTAAAIPAAAAAQGFVGRVNYTATASVTAAALATSGVSASDTSTSDGPGAPDPVGLLVAPSGSFVVTLSAAALPSGGSFLIAANDYQGSVTLRLTPGV